VTSSSQKTQQNTGIWALTRTIAGADMGRRVPPEPSWSHSYLRRGDGFPAAL